MIRCNHAYQKLFPFIVACHSSLPPLLLPCINDQHIVKLHLPVLEPIVRYDIKLQPCSDLV
jgi:hypothetical protein